MPTFSYLRVKGRVQPRRIVLAANSIRGRNFTAADPLECNSKKNFMRLSYREGSGTVPATKRQPLYQANRAGNVVAFRVAFADGANTANNITIDLLRNGTSILDAPIETDNAVDYEVFTAVFLASATSIAYAAGDLFEIDIVKTSGTDEGIRIDMAVEES